MKKDRLIVLTDAVLAIIMTILVLELENQQHQVLKLLGFTAKFLCLFSFLFWLGSLWMALNTLWEKVEKNFLRNYLVEFVSTLERQEFSLENFMPSKIPV